MYGLILSPIPIKDMNVWCKDCKPSEPEKGKKCSTMLTYTLLSAKCEGSEMTAKTVCEKEKIQDVKF